MDHTCGAPFRVATPDSRSADLQELIARNPNLADSLAVFLDGEDPAQVDGPLLELIPDLTFSPAARRRKNSAVRPPLLGGLAMQILQARIDGVTDVTLESPRSFLIELRLAAFGLLAQDVERVSGLRFLTSDVQLEPIGTQQHRRRARNTVASEKSEE
jgi:hypothetical protein